VSFTIRLYMSFREWYEEEGVEFGESLEVAKTIPANAEREINTVIMEVLYLEVIGDIITVYKSNDNIN